MTEQELIQRCFKTQTGRNVLVGIGDDAAVVESDGVIVMALDSLVVERHFRLSDGAENIGHKSLAVNLSDLAAMGSVPRWALLSLSLPSELDEKWVGGFAEGFLNLAGQWDLALIGGDLVRGPLVITVQVCGEPAGEQILLRSGANEQDGIYMTGDIGNAGFAWHRATQLPADNPASASCLQSSRRPTPRIAEGIVLASYASAAIDISDGLLLDLSRLLEASGKGGQVDLDKVPLGDGVAALLDEKDWLLPLTAGDDYELLFTMPDKYASEVREKFAKYGTAITRIGQVIGQGGLQCTRNGAAVTLPSVLGFDHFGDAPS